MPNLSVEAAEGPKVLYSLATSGTDIAGGVGRRCLYSSGKRPRRFRPHSLPWETKSSTPHTISTTAPWRRVPRALDRMTCGAWITR
jgi:hypothetical protein